MPKGYKKPADWDGFATAAADAMFEQELALVRRDHPAPPTYDALREQLEAAERSAREMHIAADRFLRERDALREQLAKAEQRIKELEAQLESHGW